MRQVVFKEDFFDGRRRYKAHETYEVADTVVLPTQDIISINGEPFVAAPTAAVRARNADGTLKGDDPETPDVNEAWEGGQKPKAKRKVSKKKAS
tara:strand:- start:343 stop:624 length:282 start_codon:yes stop_codon:yes gene_type:complete